VVGQAAIDGLACSPDDDRCSVGEDMRVTDAAGGPMASRVVPTRSLLRRFSRAADVIARSTTGPRQPTTAEVAGRIGAMSCGPLTREMNEAATGSSLPTKVVRVRKAGVTDRLTGSNP
jgi:hypothetical protein